MSYLDLKNNTNFPENQNNRATQELKDQLVDTGSEMKQRAGQALRGSTEVASDQFRQATDAAKDAASKTADDLQDKAREQRQYSADFVDRFAGNIRKAAHAFDNDAPFAARGINSAADYVEDTADKIRNGSFRDLLDNATTFAKRQPVAFLGLSVFAGFAAVRFLKASREPSQGHDRQGENNWAGTSSNFGE